MASRGLEWKVGLFVLLATLLFVGGTIYLGQKELGQSGPRVRVAFPEVGGLNPGDPVMVSGLRRGAVARIDLGPENVFVTLKLRPDVVLRSDARFSIENMGIMGEKFVAVVPGTASDTLDTRIVARGGYSPGLTEAMAQLGLVLDDVGSIVSRVESVLQEQDLVEPLKETVRLLRDVSGELDTMLVENRDDVRSSIVSFRSLTENLDAALLRNRGKLDSTAVHAAAASARFEETMNRLDGSVRSLEAVVRRIEQGEGTLGKLSKDDELYQDLLESVQSLNALLQDLRANPKRYFKIEVF
jgi:phospholipid/cholesterol/gamma-HCH transport system substrate-binding protein